MSNALNPEFYRAIVQNSHDLISVINPEGIYSYVGDSVVSQLGYLPEELTGNSALQYIHPDDLEETIAGLSAVAESKQIDAKPFRFRHRDGSWRWMRCTITNMLDNPAINGYVTNTRDITPEVNAEAVRKRQEAYYKALFYNHPDLVFTMNAAGYIEASNTNLSQITGYITEEALGKHFTYFLDGPYVNEALQAFRKALNGTAHSFETRIKSQSNIHLDLSITLVPVLISESIIAIHGIVRDITEMKRATTMLQEQAMQLNSMLETVTEAFFALDRDWNFTYANPTFARYFNMPAATLLHNNIWQILPEFQHSIFHNKCEKVLETGIPTEYEEHIAFLNATIQYSIYPFDNGIAVCFTDISAKQAAQNKLKTLSLVASKTTNGVIITDSQGHIEWVNDSFTHMTGYSLQEVLQHDPTELLIGPKTDPDEVLNLRRMLCLDVPFSLELFAYKKNGDTFWVAADITPILSEKLELDKFIVLYTDISERKYAEAKLLQLNNNLVNQNRDLQQFTYIVSHNLRAPVANIVGLSRMLHKLDPLSPKYEEAHANLDKSAQRLDTVINDLNSILSVRIPDATEAGEVIKLPDVCDEVLQSLQDSLLMVGAQVEINMPDDLLLRSKRAYIYSILQNLVTNSIKYRADNRPLLLKIIGEHVTDGIQVIVQDNGSGMNMDAVRPDIFKLYKRFHANTEGKGLGLYLVKSQVEALGGTINVESAPDLGTVFRIFFKT